MCEKNFLRFVKSLSGCGLGSVGVSVCCFGFCSAWVCMLFRVCIHVVWRGDWHVASALAVSVFRSRSQLVVFCFFYFYVVSALCVKLLLEFFVQASQQQLL